MLDKRYLNTEDLLEACVTAGKEPIPVLIGNPTNQGLNLRYATLAYDTNLKGETVLVLEVDQFVFLDERDDNE